MSGEHVFNDVDLFYNLDIVTEVFIESADGVISTVNRGGYTIFGFAYFWDVIPINIVSLGRLRVDGIDVQYDNDNDKFVIDINGVDSLDFHRNDEMLYMSANRFGHEAYYSDYVPKKVNNSMWSPMNNERYIPFV
jgi:hypothetical protein